MLTLIFNMKVVLVLRGVCWASRVYDGPFNRIIVVTG